MKGVGIVGGGITGLVAGWRLKEQGIPVTIYESSDKVGGVIETHRANGFLAESGPNTILETHPCIKELVAGLGLEEERLYSQPQANARYIIRKGKMIAVPASPPQFLTSELFSPSAKWKLIKEPFVPKGPSDQDESVADFVLRRLGQEFLDYAVNPLVGGIYAGDPRQLSVKYAFPRLFQVEQQYGSLIRAQIFGGADRKKSAEKSKQDAPKFSFKNGLQTLTDALGSKLGASIRRNSPVVEMSQNAGGFRIGSRNADSRFDHDAVLLAAPAFVLSEMLVTEMPGLQLKPLGEISYPPVATHVLGFKKEHVKGRLDGFGFLVPEKENLAILGCLFSSSIFPGRAPDDYVTLTCYIGGSRSPKLALASVGEQVALMLRDLGTTLGVSGKPVFHYHRIFRKAIPQYKVGYSRFLELMNNAEEKFPGLYFAGNYRHGISISDSILSGWKAADKIAEFLQRDKAATREAVESISK